MKCALCQQTKPLCDSHIIPEFFYKKLYDSEHSYFFVSTDPSKGAESRRKGIYEKLLCTSCEKQIGSFEDYSSKVLSGNVTIDDSHRPNWIVLRNLDYTKFKLFQISLLWRAGVSARKEFSKCDLGPHGERMRIMLLNGQPGEPYEYGCFIFFFPTAQKEMQRIVYPPELAKSKINGHRCYLAVFGGLMWVYLVSKHTKSFRHGDVFLSKEGDQPIFNIGITGMKWAIQLADDMKSTGKLR